MKNNAGATIVIATGGRGERTGLTAAAVCSLSDSPPTVQISVNKNASAHPVIRKTGFFSVNALSNEQKDLAACFSGQTGLKGEERFSKGHWITQKTGAPVMAEALASLDCELIHEHDRGTHSVFVGLVKAISSDAESLYL